jgi:hypothetical protein
VSLYPSSTTYPSGTLYPSFTSPGPTTAAVVYKVEIAFGMTDFSGDFDDVTYDVTSLTIREGRDTNAGAFGPGECSLTLQRFQTPDDDPDFAGGRELYNPTSFLSPLSPQYDPVGPGPFPTQQSPGARPLIPMRVTMTVDGTSRVLFYGWLSSWKYNRETGEARVIARDFLWRLARIRPEFLYDAGETTASAIQQVLEAYPWTDYNLAPAIGNGIAGTGDPLPLDSLEPDGESRSGLQIIDELLETELGTVVMNGPTLVYENRYGRSLRKRNEYLFEEVALDYEPGFEVD